MRFKVVLCLALLILIGFVGLEDVASKGPRETLMSVKGHDTGGTWQEEDNSNPPSCTKILVLTSTFVPVTTVQVVFLSRISDENIQKKGFSKAIRVKENGGKATKKPSKRDRREAIQY